MEALTYEQDDKLVLKILAEKGLTKLAGRKMLLALDAIDHYKPIVEEFWPSDTHKASIKCTLDYSWVTKTWMQR